MAWVPMREEISKTTVGKLMLKSLKDDVLVQQYVQANTEFDHYLPGFFQLTKDKRSEMFNQFLEKNQIRSLDRMTIKLLMNNLPYTLETPYILHYLCQRLKPNALTTYERFVQSKEEALSRIDVLKQFQVITKLEALDEEFIKNTIIFEAAKDYKTKIEKNITQQMDKFMAEMRGNWMKKLSEERRINNECNLMIQRLEKTIWKNMPSKEFCRLLYVRLDKMEQPLNNMLAICFGGRNRRLKRYANIVKRNNHQIRNLLEKKMRNITIREEEEALNVQQMKKDGSFWHAQIYNMIKQNDEWFKTYQKLNMNLRLKIVTEIGKEAPEFNHYDEHIEYFQNKIGEIYNKYRPMLESSANTSMITQDGEEMEEIEVEEEETKEIEISTQRRGKRHKSRTKT